MEKQKNESVNIIEIKEKYISISSCNIDKMMLLLESLYAKTGENDIFKIIEILINKN